MPLNGMLTHNVSKTSKSIIECVHYHLTNESSIEHVSACPICKDPVTLGGGITIENTPLSLLSSDWNSGLKRPDFSHQSYQVDSTLNESYFAGKSSVMSFKVC